MLPRSSKNLPAIRFVWPTMFPMSEYSESNTSRRRKTARSIGVKRSNKTRKAIDNDSSILMIPNGSLPGSVTIGSGNHSPTYSSRFTRADCKWLIHIRLTIVTRNALGDAMLVSLDCCQRIKVSCSMSSASATLPSMRYAIENSRLRYWSKVARQIDIPGSVCCPSPTLESSFLLPTELTFIESGFPIVS